MQPYDKNILAFIAPCGEDIIAVFLTHLPDMVSPNYQRLSDVAEYVHSYGKDWRLEVSLDSDTVDPYANIRRYYNGGLILDNDRYLLFVKPDFRSQHICLDLGSGELMEVPERNFEMFLKWSVSVRGDGGRFRELVSFSVGPNE